MSSKLPPYFLVSDSVRQSAIRLLFSLPIDADKPFVMHIKEKTRSLEQSAKLHAENEELKSSPAIPEGFAIVPIEPTIKMLDACLVDGATESQRKVKNVYADIWAKMLAAAR